MLDAILTMIRIPIKSQNYRHKIHDRCKESPGLISNYFLK